MKKIHGFKVFIIVILFLLVLSPLFVFSLLRYWNNSNDYQFPSDYSPETAVSLFHIFSVNGDEKNLTRLITHEPEYYYIECPEQHFINITDTKGTGKIFAPVTPQKEIETKKPVHFLRKIKTFFKPEPFDNDNPDPRLLQMLARVKYITKEPLNSFVVLESNIYQNEASIKIKKVSDPSNIYTEYLLRKEADGWKIFGWDFNSPVKSDFVYGTKRNCPVN